MPSYPRGCAPTRVVVWGGWIHVGGDGVNRAICNIFVAILMKCTEPRGVGISSSILYSDCICCIADNYAKRDRSERS